MKGKKRPMHTQAAVSGKKGRATNAAAKKGSAKSSKTDWNCHDDLGSKPKGGKEI